jgi:hypothetical protein
MTMMRSLGLKATGALLALAAIGVRAQVPSEVVLEVEGQHAAPGMVRFDTGTWTVSVGKSLAGGLTRPGETAPVHTRFINGTQLGSATFVAQVPAEGTYEVFVTWSSSGNATNVLYTIHASSGDATVTLDQDGWGGSGQSNGNRWISLGIYPLAGGTTPVVTVTSQADSRPLENRNAHRVYADAIRLMPSGASAAISAAPPAPEEPSSAFEPAEPAAANPASTAPAATEVNWRTDLDAARAEASSSGRRIFLYACSAQSRGCRQMESGTLADPRVIETLNGVVPVRLDLTADPSQAAELSLYRVPTFILMNSQGSEITRQIGTMTAEELVSLLN